MLQTQLAGIFGEAELLQSPVVARPPTFAQSPLRDGSSDQLPSLAFATLLNGLVNETTEPQNTVAPKSVEPVGAIQPYDPVGSTVSAEQVVSSEPLVATPRSNGSTTDIGDSSAGELSREPRSSDWPNGTASAAPNGTASAAPNGTASAAPNGTAAAAPNGRQHGGSLSGLQLDDRHSLSEPGEHLLRRQRDPHKQTRLSTRPHVDVVSSENSDSDPFELPARDRSKRVPATTGKKTSEHTTRLEAVDQFPESEPRALEYPIPIPDAPLQLTTSGAGHGNSSVDGVSVLRQSNSSRELEGVAGIESASQKPVLRLGAGNETAHQISGFERLTTRAPRDDVSFGGHIESQVAPTASPPAKRHEHLTNDHIGSEEVGTSAVSEMSLSARAYERPTAKVRTSHDSGSLVELPHKRGAPVSPHESAHRLPAVARRDSERFSSVNLSKVPQTRRTIANGTPAGHISNNSKRITTTGIKSEIAENGFEPSEHAELKSETVHPHQISPTSEVAIAPQVSSLPEDIDVTSRLHTRPVPQPVSPISATLTTVANQSKQQDRQAVTALRTVEPSRLNTTLNNYSDRPIELPKGLRTVPDQTAATGPVDAAAEAQLAIVSTADDDSATPNRGSLKQVLELDTPLPDDEAQPASALASGESELENELITQSGTLRQGSIDSEIGVGAEREPAATIRHTRSLSAYEHIASSSGTFSEQLAAVSAASVSAEQQTRLPNGFITAPISELAKEIEHWMAEGQPEASVSTESRRVEIQVDPPELGRVFVEVTRDGDDVAARIIAAEQSTWAALENSSGSLRQALLDTGLNLSGFDLSHGDSFDRSSDNHRSEAIAREDTSKQPVRERASVYRTTPQQQEVNLIV